MHRSQTVRRISVMHVGARRVPVFLSAATLIPIAALGWLGMRTLQQERELESQRQRDRLEVAAGRVALDIERRLQDTEEKLTRGAGVQFLPTGIVSGANLRVLFQPIQTPLGVVSLTSLAAAEVQEFRQRNLPAAEAEYRLVASTSHPPIRAIALAGLARVRRLQKEYDSALEAYDELERLGTTLVAGQPAGLVARQGRCKTLEEAGDDVRFRAEVRDLARALESGDWPIDRATFELYREMLVQWKGTPPSSTAIARTESFVELWHLWRRGDLGSRGRRVFRREPVSVLAVWTGDAQSLYVWLATTSDIETEWRPLWEAQNLSVALSDVEGGPLVGVPGNLTVSLSPRDTRLPFILSASPARDDGTDRAGRRVLAIGLALALLVTLAAAYALYRTTTRELALASQQADFVAAVSHEFRTPLTSMRHLTELLESRAVTSDERRAHYYALLSRETERLHRMVESLLTLGRMDVDAYAWQLEPAEVEQIVRGIVDEFRGESIAAGRQVYCDVEERLPAIRADHEALSRALWNLLENAVKYSEAGTPIHVFATRQGESVLLGVRDEGAGIPRAEQRRIFQKFVRGSKAKLSGVGGVGLGLALVTHIVEAHGGSVRLDSEPGRGSTFTLVLPCLES
jgi:signal transduction histidine kinase